VLRTFRVLRPLRSLARAEGLKKIIGAVLDSIPDLYWVIVLLVFVLLVFSIAGLVFWNGIFESVCRLTPFPVTMPAGCYSVDDDCWGTYVDTVSTYYAENYYDADGTAKSTYVPADDPYRCVRVVADEEEWLHNNYDGDAAEGDSQLDNVEAWAKDTSPWASPLDCIWPIDGDDYRPCSGDNGEGSGMHTCGVVTDYKATCGSNFDAFGNPRFIDGLLDDENDPAWVALKNGTVADVKGVPVPDEFNPLYVPYGSVPRMVDATFLGLNFGYTSYDNIFRAFVTTFQACSMEGWTDIMYGVMDAWSVIPAVLIFVLLVLVGGNIVLNLVLAVVSESIETMNEEIAEEKREANGGEDPEPEPVVEEEDDDYTKYVRVKRGGGGRRGAEGGGGATTG
jgi:hypothetical protein